MGRGERERNKREKKKRKKKKEKKQSCPIFFTVFRRLEFDSPRVKVGLLDESYE